ncbi:MAG: hypothetical protein JXR40_02900 [Pontiellaceae bacterium]|nr:hypothetical protein [Pontiellaceae bacterium]
MRTIYLKRLFLGMLLLGLCPLCFSDQQMFYRVVSDQPSQILSFSPDGVLAWSNSVPFAMCRIESIPSLSETPLISSLSAEFPCEKSIIHVKMPMHPMETPIILSIYSDEQDQLMETWALPKDPFSIAFQIGEEPPSANPQHFTAYAYQDGCYTMLYNFTNNQEISIELDPISLTPFTMTGTLFAKQPFAQDGYCSNQTIRVTTPSGQLQEIATDQFGRYAITNTEVGIYTLDFTYQYNSFSFQVTNSASADYSDLSFYEPFQAAAPNIYLYPETETNVTVALDFPCGEMTVSDPPYNDGWSVSVNTNGIIDGKYDYLFYEGAIPQRLVAEEGWLLNGTQLETEFRTLMAELGFQGREIDDFMDYWMPLMEGSPWYAVYPQDPAVVSSLNISPVPDSVLRYHFVVRPLPQPISIPQPTITPFERNGFTVVEWGVSGWE